MLGGLCFFIWTRTHKQKQPHQHSTKDAQTVRVTLQPNTYNKSTFSGATNGNFRRDQRFAAWLK